MQALLKIFAFILVAASFVQAEEQVLRIGHFPNLTHAPALLAHARWRAAPQAFEEAIGSGAKIEWLSYNAGPSAMEALLVGALDIAYVGPNPAINAYQRSKGKEVRILAGATFGGAALVVLPAAGIKSAQDFRGKRIGTPQLGNTQDIAARYWLLQNGLKVTQVGGDAFVLPAENPELLNLFASGQLDAVWTVEPWVSRLEREAKGKVFLNEDDALTTLLVCSSKVLREKPALVSAFLKMHKSIIGELNSASARVKSEIGAELKAEMLREVEPALIESAWQRMRFSSEISKQQLTDLVSAAQQVGFLKDVGDISGILHASE